MVEKHLLNEVLLKNDDNQYSVIYTKEYEFSLTRKVVFSEQSNKVYRI